MTAVKSTCGVDGCSGNVVECTQEFVPLQETTSWMVFLGVFPSFPTEHQRVFGLPIRKCRDLESETRGFALLPTVKVMSHLGEVKTKTQKTGLCCWKSDKEKGELAPPKKGSQMSRLVWPMVMVPSTGISTYPRWMTIPVNPFVHGNAIERLHLLRSTSFGRPNAV